MCTTARNDSLKRPGHSGHPGHPLPRPLPRTEEDWSGVCGKGNWPTRPVSQRDHPPALNLVHDSGPSGRALGSSDSTRTPGAGLAVYLYVTDERTTGRRTRTLEKGEPSDEGTKEGIVKGLFPSTVLFQRSGVWRLSQRCGSGIDHTLRSNLYEQKS